MNRVFKPVWFFACINIGAASIMAHRSYQDRLKREMYYVEYSREYSRNDGYWREASGIFTQNPDDRYVDNEQFRNYKDLKKWVRSKKEQDKTFQVKQLIIKRPGSFFFEKK